MADHRDTVGRRRSVHSTVLRGVLGAACAAAIAAATGAQVGGKEPAALSQPLRQKARELTRHGAQYLLAAQEKDGGWASQSGPGITCLALKALIQEPGIGPDHPAVARGIRFVLRFQRDDGGVYSADGLLKNYETSVVLSMFAALKSDGSS